MLNSANLILNKFTKTLVKTDRGGEVRPKTEFSKTKTNPSKQRAFSVNSIKIQAVVKCLLLYKKYIMK